MIAPELSTEVRLAHCMNPDVGLPSLPSGSVDLVFTDPPYSSGGLYRGDRSQPTSAKYQSSDAEKLPEFSGDAKDQRAWTSWCSWWLEECYRAAKPTARLVMFVDWRQLSAATDAIQWAGWIFRGIATWAKITCRPTMGGFAAGSEFMLWASKGPLPQAGAAVYSPNLPSVITCDPPRDRIHPTQKPIELCEQVGILAPPGGLIVDPFAGAASIALAARNIGRPSLSIEFDPYWHGKALDRLAREQLTIPGSVRQAPPAPPPADQLTLLQTTPDVVG